MADPTPPSQEIAAIAQQLLQEYGETPLVKAYRELQELLEQEEAIQSEDAQSRVQQSQIQSSIAQQIKMYTGKAADLNNIKVQVSDAIKSSGITNTSTMTKIDKNVTRIGEFIMLTQEIIQAIEIQESNITSITPKKIGDYDDKKAEKAEKMYDDILAEQTRISVMNLKLETPLPDTSGVATIIQKLKEETTKLKDEIAATRKRIEDIDEEEEKSEIEYQSLLTWLTKEKDETAKKRKKEEADKNMAAARKRYNDRREQEWKKVYLYLQAYQRDAEKHHRIIKGVIERIRMLAETEKNEEERKRRRFITEIGSNQGELENLRDALEGIIRQMNKITKEKNMASMSRAIRTLNGVIQGTHTKGNVKAEQLLSEIKTMNDTLEDSIRSMSGIQPPITKELKRINDQINAIETRIKQLSQ